ncbi:MAG TPA: lipid-binding SYLF domain-containing protein [Tepidisphaeraceae bacterium]
MVNIKARGLALLAAASVFAGCAAAPKNSQERQDLNDKAVAAVHDFEETDSGMYDLLHNSTGYAMFPDVGKGGLVVGAAYGHAEVFRHGHAIGWADMSLGSVGAQVGGEEYQELIVFQTHEALYRFINNNFTFGGNVSAVAVKAGAAATAEFKDGVAVFVKTTGGLMAEASLSGQKFNYVPREVASHEEEYDHN